MSLLVPISRTPSRNASPNSLASSPRIWSRFEENLKPIKDCISCCRFDLGDWVFRVCDFSLKPAKTCVFKEIRFFGFLTFLCSLRRPLYLRKSPILQKLWVSWRVLQLICFGDLCHHCYTKLADGVPLSQTRSLRGHTSFGRLHRIATSEHCTGRRLKKQGLSICFLYVPFASESVVRRRFRRFWQQPASRLVSNGCSSH